MKKNESKLTIGLPSELAEGLDDLSTATRVPKAVYVREAIEDLLKKYDAQLREARKSNPKTKR